MSAQSAQPSQGLTDSNRPVGNRKKAKRREKERQKKLLEANASGSNSVASPKPQATVATEVASSQHGSDEQNASDAEEPTMGGKASKKNKKKQKQKQPLQDHESAAAVIAAVVGSTPNRPSGISRDKIWSTDNEEERERIKQFWMGLGDCERRALVRVEKDAILRKMKEQQKHTCSCSVCGRKRVQIETELEGLYDAYYKELEQFAQHDGAPLLPAPAPPPLSAPPPRLTAAAAATATSGRPLQQQQSPSLLLPPQHERHVPSRAVPDDNSSTVADDGYDYDDDGVYGQVAGVDPDVADFLAFGSSLRVKGGILTVADDLLKNDGKRFIEMMENLASRRMRAEDADPGPGYPAPGHYLAPPMAGGSSMGGGGAGGAVAYGPPPPHTHVPPPPPPEEDYDDDEADDESAEDADYADEEEDEEDFEEDELSDEQRLEEGRRMFQIFAARMFEQRVLSAYKERVAHERQQKLLEELEDEDRQTSEQKAKKAKDAQRKKERAAQRKKAVADAKARKEEEVKAAEEARQRLEEKQRYEEEARKRDDRKRMREEALKRDEAVRQEREALRLQRKRAQEEQQESRARQAREAREAKEQQQREKQQQQQQLLEQQKREEDEARAKQKKAAEDRARHDREKERQLVLQQQQQQRQKELQARAEKEARAKMENEIKAKAEKERAREKAVEEAERAKQEAARKAAAAAVATAAAADAAAVAAAAADAAVAATAGEAASTLTTSLGNGSVAIPATGSATRKPSAQVPVATPIAHHLSTPTPAASFLYSPKIPVATPVIPKAVPLRQRTASQQVAPTTTTSSPNPNPIASPHMLVPQPTGSIGSNSTSQNQSPHPLTPIQAPSGPAMPPRRSSNGSSAPFSSLAGSPMGPMTMAPPLGHVPSPMSMGMYHHPHHHHPHHHMATPLGPASLPHRQLSMGSEAQYPMYRGPPPPGLVGPMAMAPGLPPPPGAGRGFSAAVPPPPGFAGPVDPFGSMGSMMGQMSPMPDRSPPQQSQQQHSRQASMSFENPLGTPRPLPIGRPTSVVQSSPHRSSGPSDDFMERQLGSSALLGDEDPIDMMRHRPATALHQQFAPASPYLGSMQPFGNPTWGAPLGYPTQSPFAPINAWDRPAGQLSSPGLVQTAISLSRPQEVRARLCRICSDMVQTGATTSDRCLGFAEVLRRMQNTTDHAMTEDSLLVYCETEGNDTNGGGTFEIIEGEERLIRWTSEADGGSVGAGPAPSAFMPRAVGAVGAPVDHLHAYPGVAAARTSA